MFREKGHLMPIDSLERPKYSGSRFQFMNLVNKILAGEMK